jgi:multiple sugar transport system permease protein
VRAPAEHPGAAPPHRAHELGDPGRSAARPAPGRAARRRNEAIQGLLLFGPAALVIFGFIFFPVGYSVWLSMTDKHLISPDYGFVALENYQGLAFDLDYFWWGIGRGIVFSMGSIALQVLLGLGAALLLNQPFHGRGFVRGLTLFPYMLPTIVVVLLWKWLLSAMYGPVNFVLQALGIIQVPIVWLGDRWLMAMTIFVAVWQFFPFVVISLLARLQTIDLQLYEAAAIDGAGAWKRFRHVTLPELRHVLFVVILLRTFFMFTKFDVPWLMAAGGGLLERVQTLPIYAFRKTFGYFQAGEGAAISVCLFLLLVLLSIVYFRAYRREAEA